jgi:hypothetical protein
MIGIVVRSRVVVARPTGSTGPSRVALGIAGALLVALGAAALAQADGALAASLWEGVLYLLPALLLGLALLAGRHPGERLIGALLEPGARPRVRMGAVVRGIELSTPHGGRLIAVSLGGRAPPRLWAGARGLL